MSREQTDCVKHNLTIPKKETIIRLTAIQRSYPRRISD
jgi:hypothetical protein